jgi:hypothetical protein
LSSHLIYRCIIFTSSIRWGLVGLASSFIIIATNSYKFCCYSSHIAVGDYVSINVGSTDRRVVREVLSATSSTFEYRKYSRMTQS